jgi:spore germination protein GerM
MKKQLQAIGILFVAASLFVGCNSALVSIEPDLPSNVVPVVKDAPVATPAIENTAEASTKTMIVKVFFNNPETDPNWSFECSNVFAVERTIPKTDAVALAAINELLKGPTAAEKEKGYMSNINSGVKVKNLSIKDSVAKIDFNEQLQFQVGGSCKVSAIYAQIKQTLKQFPSVKDVIISINGQTEDILQP